MASEPRSPGDIAGDVVIAFSDTAPVNLSEPMEIRIEDAHENIAVSPPPITVTNTNIDATQNLLSAHQVPSPVPQHQTRLGQTQSEASGILPKERRNKGSDGKAAAPTLIPSTIKVPKLEDDEANEKDAFLRRSVVNKRKKPHTKLKESQMIIEVQEENVHRKHRYIGRHEPLPEDYIDSRCGKYVRKFNLNIRIILVPNPSLLRS